MNDKLAFDQFLNALEALSNSQGSTADRVWNLAVTGERGAAAIVQRALVDIGATVDFAKTLPQRMAWHNEAIARLQQSPGVRMLQEATGALNPASDYELKRQLVRERIAQRQALAEIGNNFGQITERTYDELERQGLGQKVPAPTSAVNAPVSTNATIADDVEYVNPDRLRDEYGVSNRWREGSKKYDRAVSQVDPEVRKQEINQAVSQFSDGEIPPSQQTPAQRAAVMEASTEAVKKKQAIQQAKVPGRYRKAALYSGGTIAALLGLYGAGSMVNAKRAEYNAA